VTEDCAVYLGVAELWVSSVQLVVDVAGKVPEPLERKCRELLPCLIPLGMKIRARVQKRLCGGRGLVASVQLAMVAVRRWIRT